MTRLQSMFIQLSQCKTVNELEKVTSKNFVSGLLGRVAFDKDGKVHTCGYFRSCDECVLNCSDNPEKATIDYLNHEIDGSHPQQNSIIIMRDKALANLQRKFDIACKEKANPMLTAVLLDSYCDMFEDIGLFEPNECHDMLIKVTKERPKK